MLYQLQVSSFNRLVLGVFKMFGTFTSYKSNHIQYYLLHNPPPTPTNQKVVAKLSLYNYLFVDKLVNFLDRFAQQVSREGLEFHGKLRAVF